MFAKILLLIAYQTEGCGRLVKFGATEQEEKRSRLKALSEGRDLGKTTSHAASPRLPASARSRARSPSFPFPRAPFFGDISLHPSFSLPLQTPVQICAATCKLFFFSFFPTSFSLWSAFPCNSKQLTAASASPSGPAGPSPIREAMAGGF